MQIVDCHFKSRSRPDKKGKSNKNNNQIEHPREWDLKERSRDPRDRSPLQKRLISQFTKELSFKKYFDRQQRASLPRRLAVSLTRRRRRIFSRDLFRGGMSLTLYRLCRERLSAGLLGFTSVYQTEGPLADSFSMFGLLAKNLIQSIQIVSAPNSMWVHPLAIDMKMWRVGSRGRGGS